MQPPAPAQHRGRPYTTLLGVCFSFEPGTDVNATAIGLTEIKAKIELATRDARRRQSKRKVVEFWDGLTYLQQALTAKDLRARPEGKLLLDLMDFQADGSVSQDVASELAQLPSLETLADVILPYRVPGRTPTLERSWAWTRCRETSEGGAVIRIVWLHVPPEETDPEDIDWIRLTILAVLAHLRAELVAWIESGFMRTRRCAQCHSWFSSSRMAGRAMFCSPYCRVSSSRKGQQK